MMGRAPGQIPEPVGWLLAGLDDLAALGLAVGGRGLGVALTLARVLARAGVPAPGAAALALAGVDPVADYLVPARRVRGPGRHRAGKQQRRGCARDHQTLRTHGTSFVRWDVPPRLDDSAAWMPRPPRRLRRRLVLRYAAY